MLPLYGEDKKERKVVCGINANNGLYYNKFVDEWPAHAAFTGLSDNRKNWVEKFRKKVGDQAELDTATERMTILVRALSGKEPMRFQTTGPFVTGLGLAHPVENGFLWHHTLGVPYLSGSSIKGMIRAWAEHWSGEATDVGHMFGRDDAHEKGPSAGALIIFDALPVKPVQLLPEVITPHVGAWRMTTDTPEPPADWVSPNPIPFLSVERGTEFQFAIISRNGEGDEYLERAYTYLEDALDWIGAGAKTSSGFGRFLTPKKVEEAQKEAEDAAKNAPLSVGDKVFYDGNETGVIEKIIDHETVLVNTPAEREPIELHISELEPNL